MCICWAYLDYGTALFLGRMERNEPGCPHFFGGAALSGGFSLCVAGANGSWIRGVEGTCIECEGANAPSSSVGN